MHILTKQYVKQIFISKWKTRTTGTPVFWWYSQLPHDYPHYWLTLDPKSKQDEVKVTNFLILWTTLHATHLLKLLDKMCKYEMDPVSNVEDTEWTQFCPQMDRRTDRQGETTIPSFNFVEPRVKLLVKYSPVWFSGRIRICPRSSGRQLLIKAGFPLCHVGGARVSLLPFKEADLRQIENWKLSVLVGQTVLHVIRSAVSKQTTAIYCNFDLKAICCTLSRYHSLNIWLDHCFMFYTQ